ncbi:MAG TPA: glycosyltransferase family 39 protein [Tepidisphaeraceae bacterium]|nr:glycosyltransferase family 39 protein [Tepidisphaeraceae bacterium]
MPLPRSATGPLIVASTGIAMLIATWGTWPDPVTDFGKEVYLAWQLSLGQRLYIDVAYHLGPLSPYVNALVFKLFGSTLLTIEIFNIAICGLIAVLVYRLINRIAGPLAATAAGVTFLTLFAFLHFTPITDYNFICPYDHAHTHGLLLGLVAMAASDRFNRTGRVWAIILAGLAVGMAFLTRAELFLPAAAGAGTILILGGRAGRRRSVLTFSIGFLTPILIAYLCLGWRAVEGSWPVVLETSVAANPFYRSSMGTLDVAGSLLRIGKWTVFWLVVLVPPLYVGRRWPPGALLWGAAAAYLVGSKNDAGEAFSPLPLALIGCAILLMWRPPEIRALSAGLLIYAFVLLAKIILNARIYHYGFVLAMPATILVVAIGIGWTNPAFRAGLIGALVVLIAAYISFGRGLILGQKFIVGEGPNQFYADERGRQLEVVLNYLRATAQPGQTLAVMPEGAMLNFLAVMPNPTPYWSFNPPYSFFSPGEGEAAGEEKIVGSLQSHPPDWIALVAEDLSDFGTPFFGTDYGVRICDFVTRNYRTELTVGISPFKHQGFGMLLMRRSVYNGHGTPP